MTKVSVIVPVYNVEPYLRECIDSILTQTLKDLELICVDDGSSDASLAILREYAARDGRMTVVEQQNLGAGVARNAGIAKATGEYCFFCDADDFLDKELLGKLYAKAKETRADVVFFTRTRWSDAQGKVVETLNLPKSALEAPQPFPPSKFPKQIISMFGPQPWNKLVRRDFINEKNICFQDLKRMNDVFFSAMVVTLAERICAYPVEGYYHRIEQQGEHLQSQAGNNKTPYIAFDVYCHMRDEMKKRGIFDEFSQSFYRAAESTFAYSLRTIDAPELLAPLFQRSKEFMMDGLREKAYPAKGRFATCDNVLAYLEDLSSQWPIKEEVLAALRTEAAAKGEWKQKSISMVCDDAYTLPCLIALTSLAFNSKNASSYKITICANGMSEENIALLEKLRGEPWKLDINIVALDLAKYESIYTQYDGNTGAGSITALAKFDLPALIDADSTLYIDGDILVKSDISELFDIDLGDSLAAVVRDSGRLYNDNGLRAELPAYFNSGVMLLNLKKMREGGYTQKLIDAKIALNNPKLVDQDAFNIAFDGKTILLPIQYNALMVNLHNSVKRFTMEDLDKFYGTSFGTFEALEDGVKILHFASKEKPWKYSDVRYADEWKHYFMRSPAAAMPLVRSLFADVKRAKTAPQKITTIGLCFSDFSQGGIQRVMSILAPQFVRAGYKVVLLTKNGEENDVYHLDVPVERVVLGAGINKDAAAARSAALTEAIKKHKIDIVIFQEYYSKELLNDTAAVTEAGIPYAIHHHNVFSNFFLRHIQDINELDYYKCFAKAAALIALSTSDEYYFRTLGCNAFYFANPIDDVPDGFTIRERNKTLVWMARYTDVKRPMDAVKIFEKVLAIHPDAKLYMLGKLEDTNMVRKIRGYVESSAKLAAAVHFEDFQSDVWRYLESATALLTTAKFEGFPCTLTEAAAAQVPTIGYELPYIEYAKGNPGFIQTPQGDIEAAADATCRLFSDPEMHKNACIAARKRFEELRRFDQIAAYGKLFDEICAGVRSAPVPDGEKEMILRTVITHGMTGMAELKSKIKNLEKVSKRLSSMADKSIGIPSSAKPAASKTGAPSANVPGESAKLNALRAELATAWARHDDMKSMAYELNSERAELNKALKRSEARVDHLKGTIERYRADTEKYRDRWEALRAKVAEREAMLDKYRADAAKLKAKIAALQKR